MEDLMNHIKTRLETVQTLKTVEEDEGQLDAGEKVTVQVPAAYYDITDMQYGEIGDKGLLADTEITLMVGMKLKDTGRFTLLNAITKALCHTAGDNFTGIQKISQTKIHQDGKIRVYEVVFACLYKDDAARVGRTKVAVTVGVV